MAFKSLVSKKRRTNYELFLYLTLDKFTREVPLLAHLSTLCCHIRRLKAASLSVQSATHFVRSLSVLMDFMELKLADDPERVFGGDRFGHTFVNEVDFRNELLWKLAIQSPYPFIC